MAAPNRIYALNLGTQTMSLAEFQTNQSGGIVLSRFEQGEILGDPSVDATRLAQSKLEIQSLVGKFGLKNTKVNYAIASNVVFIRPVTLPSVGDEAQVEQIVGFEAAQNVPYPINQVVWDWQLLDDGSDGSVEVILGAIKSDLLDEINEAVESSGVRAGVIEIGPLALYNAFRYNYADADGCSLIVDIGSRTTNLIFVEPGKIFPRRLNIGGSSITTAIAKDLSLPFNEADQMKVEQGFVSLGGGYAEPDNADLARMSKIIRNQMTRLHQEIARSITFYRSEHGGAQPTRVLLAGGTASFPYMREFFQEKFAGMEVDFFNPLRNVSVAGGLNVDEIGRKAHTIGELVGLALRSANSCPLELSLRPQSVVAAEARASQKPFIVATGVCIVAALGAMYAHYTKAAAVTGDELEKVKSKVSRLEPKESAIRKSRDEVMKKMQEAAPLTEAVSDREYWVRVIEDINSRLPEDYIWITELLPPTDAELQKALKPADAPKKPGAKPKADAVVEAPAINITINGLVLENPRKSEVFDDFIKNLSESPYVEPPKDSEKLSRPSMKNDVWADKFSFPLRLKTPISLK
jgi:type IV pilus assembly protein PilM